MVVGISYFLKSENLMEFLAIVFIAAGVVAISLTVRAYYQFRRDHLRKAAALKKKAKSDLSLQH